MSRKVILDTSYQYNPVPVLLNEPGMRRAVERFMKSDEYFGGHWNERGPAEMREGKIFLQDTRYYIDEPVVVQRSCYYHPPYLG